MFVNYVKDATRPSPLNLAAARILLGTWLAWRILSLEWGAYQEWPFPIRSPGAFLFTDLLLGSLPYLQWLVVFFLGLFVLGYRIRLTGSLAGFGLMLMMSVTTGIYLAGTVETLMVGAYLLLLFAFFAEDDVLSIDGFADTKNQSLDELNTFLKEGPDESYRIRPLKYGLLVVAVMYFGAGWGKVRDGGIEVFMSGADLQRVLLRVEEYHDMARIAAQPLIHNPDLAWLSYLGTVSLQLSLIVAILVGVTLTPIVLGLMGFHLMVILTMGLYFIDMFLYLGLFTAWDGAYQRLAKDEHESITLVYDEHCYFCARSLAVFKHLDINESIEFYSQYDAPPAYTDRQDLEFDEEMYVFRDGEAYGGYWAFRELLRQFSIFTPVVWAMNRRPIAFVGERVYRYVAANRDRYFVCSTGA